MIICMMVLYARCLPTQSDNNTDSLQDDNGVLDWSYLINYYSKDTLDKIQTTTGQKTLENDEDFTKVLDIVQKGNLLFLQNSPAEFKESIGKKRQQT